MLNINQNFDYWKLDFMLILIKMNNDKILNLLNLDATYL